MGAVHLLTVCPLRLFHELDVVAQPIAKSTRCLEVHNHADINLAHDAVPNDALQLLPYLRMLPAHILELVFNYLWDRKTLAVKGDLQFAPRTRAAKDAIRVIHAETAAFYEVIPELLWRLIHVASEPDRGAGHSTNTAFSASSLLYDMGPHAHPATNTAPACSAHALRAASRPRVRRAARSRRAVLVPGFARCFAPELGKLRIQVEAGRLPVGGFVSIVRELVEPITIALGAEHGRDTCADYVRQGDAAVAPRGRASGRGVGARVAPLVRRCLLKRGSSNTDVSVASSTSFRTRAAEVSDYDRR